MLSREEARRLTLPDEAEHFFFTDHGDAQLFGFVEFGACIVTGDHVVSFFC
jgi:hypothetical protein